MSDFIIQNESDLEQLALKLKPQILEAKQVLFYGEMGAGKTTFIKALCKVLGFNEDVSSPTYSLVNEYPIPNSKIYHFDLFRIESMHEALDIGFEDYLDKNAICLIEWPQKVEALVDNGLKVEIEKIDFNTRKFSIFKF